MLEFKRYPPLQKLAEANFIKSEIDRPIQRAVNQSWSTWSGNYLDIMGQSLDLILTKKERASLGIIYLDMVPAVLEFNAKTCAVEGGMLILLPMGIFHLPVLNAQVYAALSALTELRKNTYADWRIRLQTDQALRNFGEKGTLKGLAPEIRKLIKSSIKAIKDFDKVLRIAVAGMVSNSKFPKTMIDSESWNFSDAVTLVQWQFIIGHELGHILAGDCKKKYKQAFSLVPGLPAFQVYQFPQHKEELLADRWASKSLLRHEEKQRISLPIDLLFFLIKCLDETAYFFDCKFAREKGNPNPPKSVSTHPTAGQRRKALTKVIGKFDDWMGFEDLFELVSAFQQREITR